jgi:hypothetical protein
MQERWRQAQVPPGGHSQRNHSNDKTHHFAVLVPPGLDHKEQSLEKYVLQMSGRGEETGKEEWREEGEGQKRGKERERGKEGEGEKRKRER